MININAAATQPAVDTRLPHPLIQSRKQTPSSIYLQHAHHNFRVVECLIALRTFRRRS